MFRIEVFVEDKRLADALRALAGIARGQPAVMPVANLVEGGGKLKAATNGTLHAMFAAWLAKHKAESLAPADIREWIKATGHRSANSAGVVSYVANVAVKQQLLRRTGKGNQVRYILIRKKK